jgi:hypothetical protein
LEEIYSNIREDNQALYELVRVLPYENIADIDEKGDDLYDRPHVYTIPFDLYNAPFLKEVYETLHTIHGERRHSRALDETRVMRFPGPTDRSD